MSAGDTLAHPSCQRDLKRRGGEGYLRIAPPPKSNSSLQCFAPEEYLRISNTIIQESDKIALLGGNFAQNRNKRQTKGNKKDRSLSPVSI